MNIEQWCLTEAAPLAEIYNGHAAEIPFEHSVSQENFVEAITRPTKHLGNELLFVAVNAGQPKGFVHVGMVAAEDSPNQKGLIRFLAFPRNERGMGQALVDRAHAYLHGLGASACQAFDYRFGYPCTWVGSLKSPWEHIYALLGINGYHIEGHWGRVAVWSDYEMSEPVLPNRELEVRVDDTPFFPHLTSYGDLPTVVVRVFRNNAIVGGNETRPYYLPYWGEVPQNMCYTAGMGVNEAERGQGIGRYLMERSLYEMQRLGCHHAILDVDPNNFPALMLYASMGYRTVYSICKMAKVFESIEPAAR
jgi:GNAT superfamily N-acetyltransferase